MKGFILTMVLFACAGAFAQEKLQRPETRISNVKDVYFGTEVADPYRWLEDDNSEETKAWVEAQNKVTFDYLSQIPFREKIKNRYEKLYNYPKYSAPFKAGNKYFFFKNDGLQNQSVLYVQNNLEAEPEIFLDPNKLSEDGTVALSTMAISKDGKYFAYGTASGGSDWNEFHILKVDDKQKLEDRLSWIKFSGISWKDEGFYYTKYPTPKEGEELSSANQNSKIYYHKLGTQQSDDKLIYEDPANPLHGHYAQTTEDERFLIVYISKGTSNNGLMVKDLNDTKSGFIKLVGNFENNYSVIDNIGDKLLIQTDKDAGRGRLILIDPKNPAEDNWQTLVPEQKEVLQSVSLVGGKMMLGYMKDASTHVYAYDLNGKELGEVKLPAIGSVGGFSGKKEDNIAFYTFTSFTYPSIIYKYDVEKGTSEVFRRTELDFDFDAYDTKQVFYKSKDGTEVPMFIVHKKGLKLDGTNPTYLYAYGGFNISLTPSFSSSRLILLENGGVFAMANLRGGGEYGEDWHKAGMLFNKQNVFDDFIAAADYLIDEKYTSTERLAVAGGSNGGLLIGAVINQRPELFKVAFPAVGVMDMLRYHKFTIGHAWAVEYGSSENETQFNNLYAYSPIHNIKKDLHYPAVMVSTADHDDRVVPAHSFKYIATLQQKYTGENPVLIRIETKAGHGAGKPTVKIIEEQADYWAFMFYNMNFTPKY